MMHIAAFGLIFPLGLLSMAPFPSLLNPPSVVLTGGELEENGDGANLHSALLLRKVDVRSKFLRPVTCSSTCVIQSAECKYSSVH